MRRPENTIAKLVALAAAGVVLGVAGHAAPAAADRDTALGKAGRGLAGMTCGFLELPGNMVLETRRRGPAYGLTLGFVRGLGGIVVRELVGVYEFVTSPLEIPRDFRPILSPEYPWDYFDEGVVVAESGGPVAARGLGSPGSEEHARAGDGPR